MRQPPKINLVVAPGAEPVSAADLAAWTGGSATDAVLTALATSARQACESYLGMGLITQEWHQFYDLVRTPDEWWDGVRQGARTELHRVPSLFELALYPVVSITDVNFYDWDDNATEVDAAAFYLSLHSRPPVVALRQGYAWPTVPARVRDAVRIHYTVGFGAAASDVPQAIKDGIKALAAYLFEHRGACAMEDAIKDSGAAQFWRPYKVLHV